MTADAYTTILTFDGALTVPNATAIQARLVAAVDGHGPIVLDLSEATHLDVSFLQLVVAAQKTATAKGVSLFVASHGSRMLMEEAARCGLSATAANGGRVLPPFFEGTPQ